MGKCRRLGTIFYIMAKIGLFTFGGGWSIIAQMQSEFVDKRHDRGAGCGLYVPG